MAVHTTQLWSYEQHALRRTASSMQAKRNQIRVIGYLFTTLTRPDVISLQHWGVINKNFVKRGITGDCLYSGCRKSLKGIEHETTLKIDFIAVQQRSYCANGLKLETTQWKSTTRCVSVPGAHVRLLMETNHLCAELSSLSNPPVMLCGASSPLAAADAHLTSRCLSKTAHNTDSTLTSTQRPARRPKYATTEQLWANWWGVKIPQMINYHKISDLSEFCKEDDYCTNKTIQTNKTSESNNYIVFAFDQRCFVCF